MIIRNLSDARRLVEDDKKDVNRLLLQAVHWPAKMDVIRYLVEEAKADVYAQTTFGWTAYTYAASRGLRSEIARYLCKRMNRPQMFVFLMGDIRSLYSSLLGNTHSNDRLPFTHKLYDLNIIGVVWSFVA